MTTSEGGLRRYAFPIGLAAAGVVAGAVLASGMAANADSTPTPSAGARTAETPVTDPAVADKIKAAVLAKYPGATFDAVENDGAGYEAEIVTKAGTKLHVDVSKAYVVTERQGRGPGGPGGPGRDRTETPVTDTAVADKIKAAVLAKYPGATFDAVENAGAGYEAEIVTKAGTKLHVDVSKAFVVTDRPGRGPGGPGGPGGWHGQGGPEGAPQGSGTPG